MTTDDADEAVIWCEQLTKRYPGDILAVDRLDLRVRRGEMFGLLGPNGAGKSTTAGMLTTRVVPTGGRALVAGIDVVARPAGAKQIIGVVPQTNTLDRSLNVWENLYFHGRFFGFRPKRARAAADEALGLFRLTDRAKAPVSALSGGMAQRLMAARAILHQPAVLFLDEPTAGLDPQSRLALWEIIAALPERPTVFLSTHNMEEADAQCDRVAIMDHGRILALDTPKALKAGVGADSIITISASGDVAALAALLEREVEGAHKAILTGRTIQLRVAGAAGVLPSVFSVAEAAGFTLADLSVAEPTLETVFIDLTGKELRE